MLPAAPLPLSHHLHTLHLLHPASTLVHIGPGLAGANAWYTQPPFTPTNTPIHWVEADPERHHLLQQQAPQGGPTVHHALLGAQPSKAATWHSLSNPNESGLLPASSLTALWPNIHSVAEQTMPQTTLDALLPTPTAQQWLVVDCLPAQAILQGASQHLPHTAVIVARTTAQTIAGLKDQGASLQELRDYLQPQGFALLAQEEERNPAYTQAVFVRDYAQLQQQEQQQHQASKAKLTAELKQAQTQAAELQKAAEALQVKLSTELQQAQAQITEQQANLQKAQQAKDADAKAKADLQAQLQQTQQAREVETQAAAKLKPSLLHTQAQNKELLHRLFLLQHAEAKNIRLDGKELSAIKAHIEKNDTTKGVELAIDFLKKKLEGAQKVNKINLLKNNIIISGLARSGKTELAKKLAVISGAAYLSTDNLREIFWALEDYDLRAQAKNHFYQSLLFLKNPKIGSFIIEGEDFIFIDKHKLDERDFNLEKISLKQVNEIKDNNNEVEIFLLGCQQASIKEKIESLQVARDTKACWTLSHFPDDSDLEKFAASLIRGSTKIKEATQNSDITYLEIAPLHFISSVEQAAKEIFNHQLLSNLEQLAKPVELSSNLSPENYRHIQTQMEHAHIQLEMLKDFLQRGPQVVPEARN